MSKSRLFSGKIKKKTGTALDGSRYEYLDISQAEPDLGIPTFDNAILIANTSGQRFWSQTITNVTLAGTVISSGTVTGDLLPSITNTFNLGSADLRFKTLYVSSATLDIGGVTISSTGADSLDVSKLIVSTSTNSTSTVSGALQVVGGVGIGLDLFVGGAISATSLTIGNISNNQGTLNIQSTLNSTSTDSGALTVVGGVGIGGNLYVGGEIVASKLTIEYTTVTTTLIQTDDIITTKNTTASTSTDSGALVVAGGVGIGGDIWVGAAANIIGDLGVAGKIITINTASDALQVFGGANIVGIVDITGLIYSSSSQVLTYNSTQTLLVSNALFATTSGYALSFNTGTVVTTAVNATTSSFATTSGYALSFDTSTVVTTAVNATTSSFATTSGYALSFDTSTVVTTAVNIQGGSAGGVVYQASTSTTTILPIGNDGTVLTVNSGTLTWTAASGVTAGFATTASYASTATGLGPEIIYIVNTTNSTSTTTGALVVNGGVGVGLDLHVGNNLYVANTAYLNNAEILTTSSGFTSESGVSIINQRLFVNTTTNSTSTTTGAITTPGGVGIGQDLWAGGKIYAGDFIYSNGQEVITTATINDYANQTVITAGTDTAVSTSTGNITIWNTSDLQTVTDRGHTTTNAISITNTTTSDSTITGALIVAGGVGVSGDVRIGNNLYVANTAYLNNAEILTTSSGFTSEAGVSIINQRLFVNTTTNSTSTTTGAITTPGGVGIGQDIWAGGKIYAGDFIYSNGQQVITTATINDYANQTVITAGTDTAVSTSTGNITIWNTSDLQTVTDRGQTTTNAISITNATASDSTITGALVVAGGVGIGGSLYVAGEIVAQKLTIEFTTVTTTIVETDDVIKTSNVTQSTSTTSGALQIAGGVGIGKDVVVGGLIYSAGSQVLTYSNTQTLLVAESLYATTSGYALSFNTSTLIAVAVTATSLGTDVIYIRNETASSDTSSGALQVSGGVGIGKDVYVGGQVVTSVVTSTGGLSINAGPGSGNFLTISNNGFNTVFNPGGTIQPGGAIVGSTFGATSVDVTQNVLLLKSPYYGAQIITGAEGPSGTLYTWSFGTDGQLTNPGKLIVQSSEAATSKVSGALQVSGGVGISGDLYASDVYSNGQKVVTTSTINDFANQTVITAGTDTAISTSTGNITIWNTSDLQSVTDRGHATTNQIEINNTLTSTSSFSSNALYVAGGIGGNSGFNINGDGYLHGDLTVFGSITGTNITLNVLSANSATFYGDVTGSGALYAGILGATPFAQTMAQFTGDLDDYMEINVQNINAGAWASTDIVASSDNVTESSAFIDMGITSSVWDGTAPNTFGNNLGPNDGYLLVGHSEFPTAGHLVIGTLSSETSVKIVVAGTNSNYLTAIFNTATTESISTTTGALVVYGGLGVGGSIYAASTSYINNSKILVAGDLETVTHTATYITNDPGTVSGLVAIAGTSTVYGTYDFGAVSDVWTFNDYNTGTNTGYYSIHDATGAPAFIVYFGFSGITEFNRIVININYTQNSGHTQGIDLYNYVQNQWVTFTTYSGSAGWFEFILGTIDSTPYISSGNVSARINHISSGNTAHRTWIDYIALEQSIQGGQGPRGATGATGATGAQGLTTSTTSTFNFFSTETSISTITGAVRVAGGVGIGGDLYVGGALYQSGQQIITTATINDYANQTIITAGTDTAISTSTGNITIWNTSTLQSVTDRGQTTTNAILITNATSATSTLTGALIVTGGVGISGSLYVGGEIVAQKLTIEYTTVTTTLVTTDDIISTYNTTVSTGTTTGALQVAGGAGIGGNLYVGNRVGFVNTAGNASVAYQFYNTVTNTIDMVWG